VLCRWSGRSSSTDDEIYPGVMDGKRRRAYDIFR
jgi:hypothetical protein